MSKIKIGLFKGLLIASVAGLAAVVLSPGTVFAQQQAVDCSKATALKDNCIVKDIQLVVNFLSAGVGIVVVGVIILGGIQYAMAGDSPEAIGKAKQRIINGLIALLAFIFTYSFVQWLVPGGVF